MDAEKQDRENIDGGAPVDTYPIKSHLESADNTLFEGMTDAEKKHIVRRVDVRLVTTVGFMYCVSLMDRTNLGAANIAGMSKELLLIGDRYVCLHVCCALGILNSLSIVLY
jgi:hypothetical protein